MLRALMEAMESERNISMSKTVGFLVKKFGSNNKVQFNLDELNSLKEGGTRAETKDGVITLTFFATDKEIDAFDKKDSEYECEKCQHDISEEDVRNLLKDIKSGKAKVVKI